MTLLKTAPPEAKELVKEATRALATKNLIRAFRCEIVREDGIEMIKVRNSQPIPLRYGQLLPGKWHLHVEWLLRRVPAELQLIVWRSSVGVTVEGTNVTPDGEPRCLVRYDVDNGRQGPALDPLGRHINVLQPGPLADHVHYPTFSGANDPWPVATVLDLFHSQVFIEELAKYVASS